MSLIHFALDAVRRRPAFGVVASARVYSQSTEVRACDAFEMGFARRRVLRLKLALAAFSGLEKPRAMREA